MGIDFAGYHTHNGLVFAPSYCVRRQAEWAEHDKQVCLLLGAPSNLAGRYKMCFPGKVHDIGPPSACDWCDTLVCGANASCGLHIRGDDAYVSRLCALPRQQGHGSRFVGRLNEVLRESGVRRVWLFADQGVQPKLLDFYTDKCGFLSVQRGAGPVPPEWVDEMWGDDFLFCAELGLM